MTGYGADAWTAASRAAEALAAVFAPKRGLGALAVVFAAVGSGQAAELSDPKPAPAAHAGACATLGAGFIRIAGANTCLRIGGSLAYDYDFQSASGFASKQSPASTKAGGASGDWTRARVTLDARTATAHGTVRTVLSVGANRSHRCFRCDTRQQTSD